MEKFSSMINPRKKVVRFSNRLKSTRLNVNLFCFFFFFPRSLLATVPNDVLFRMKAHRQTVVVTVVNYQEQKIKTIQMPKRVCMMDKNLLRSFSLKIVVGKFSFFFPFLYFSTRTYLYIFFYSLSNHYFRCAR